MEFPAHRCASRLSLSLSLSGSGRVLMRKIYRRLKTSQPTKQPANPLESKVFLLPTPKRAALPLFLLVAVTGKTFASLKGCVISIIHQQYFTESTWTNLLSSVCIINQRGIWSIKLLLPWTKEARFPFQCTPDRVTCSCLPPFPFLHSPCLQLPPLCLSLCLALLRRTAPLEYDDVMPLFTLSFYCSCESHASRTWAPK